MIRDYWIEELKQVKEFDLIGTIEDDELKTLNTSINNLINDQFIETATEKGIERREKLLNIIPYADDTMESRRFRIASRWDSSNLTKRLDQLCGKYGYTMQLNHNEYELLIRVELTSSRMEEEVLVISRQMAPANLLITVELRYMQHKELKRYTNRELQAYTHRQLREDDLI